MVSSMKMTSSVAARFGAATFQRRSGWAHESTPSWLHVIIGNGISDHNVWSLAWNWKSNCNSDGGLVEQLLGRDVAV